MALTGTDRGQGTHNSSATSFGLAPGSNLTAGAMAVLCVAADNAASGGTAYGTFSVTDTKGNTWTRRQTALIDPGAANAGQVGAIFTTPQNGGALTTGDTITVSFGSDAPTAKTWTLMEVTAGAGNTPTYVTGNVGTSGTGGTSPTITTGTIAINDMVIAALFLEAGTTETITQDGDSTNGSWSTQQTAEIGSTTSGSNIASQRKVVTSAATQTYNPTLGIAGDLCLAWIEIRELVNTVVTPDAASLAVTGQAPTVTATNNQRVTPDTASLALTGQVPTVTASANQLVVPAAASLAVTGQVPTVTASDHKRVEPAAAALALTGQAPSVTLGTNVVPAAASLALTAAAPTVTASDHQTAIPAAAALALTGQVPTVSTPVLAGPAAAALALTAFAPTVVASDHQRVEPPAASLALTGFAPAVGQPVAVIPDAAALELVAAVPTVTATAHQRVTPDAAALALTAFNPSVVATDHQLVVPPALGLVLAAFAPTIDVTGGDVVVEIPAGLLLLAGYIPSVTIPRPPELAAAVGFADATTSAAWLSTGSSGRAAFQPALTAEVADE